VRQLRSRRPIKGIALSGFGMEDDVRMSWDAGFAEHLIKPVNANQLEAAIRRHIADRPRPGGGAELKLADRN
jgi:CheY-like chemotaxis protein